MTVPRTDLERALVYLSDQDPDRAGERNGAGFNSRDTGIGNDLAERILNGQGLTDKQYIAARKILQTYRVQVERGTGIDVTSIPAMRAPSGAVLCRGRGPQQFTQARQPGTCGRCRGSVQVGDSIELRPGVRGGWDRFHEMCPVGSAFETTNAVEIQEPADWWNDRPSWDARELDPTTTLTPAAPVATIAVDQTDALLDEYQAMRASQSQRGVSVVSAATSVARSLELPVIQTETGQTARGVLGADGLIARRLPGYEHREVQLQASDVIERAIELGGHAVVEAGTGVGKSLAYLVPAINSGRRTMVSTADKSLQAQLWQKDVPFLQEVYASVGIEVRAALLKGRGNYVCLNRVAGLRDALIPDFKSPEAGLAWSALNDWIYGQSDTEDLADLETFEGELPAELRSEVTTDSENCFAGETRYLTQSGVRTLAETVGTRQRVLGSHGRWTDAEIRSFGVQPLLRVTLSRTTDKLTVYATAEHRWFLHPQKTKQPKDRFKERLTRDLRPGDRLASRFPASKLKGTTPSQFGVAHGIVYGDGGLVDCNRPWLGSAVELCGQKDAQLVRYFSESPRTVVEPTTESEGSIVVRNLPTAFKQPPPFDESIGYLYGWLAGYFAADGCVADDGNVIMSSARRFNLELFQTICNRLGISTRDIRESMRVGKSRGGVATPLYYLPLIGSTLTPEFFLLASHRARYEAKQRRLSTGEGKGNFEALSWRVVDVEVTDRVEEVFCAVVPETSDFVLDGNILVGNCIGKKCPQYNRCFVERAKQRAEGAQIVIVNHALLLRGVAIAAASDGFVEILPESGQVILDEAHHLEEIATDAFGAQITESRWTHALRRLERLTVGHKAIKHIPEEGADSEDAARRERAEAWSFRGRAIGREFFSRLRIYDRRLTECKTNVQRLGDERELLEPIATELGALAEAMTEATPAWLAEDERETWRKLSESVKRLAKEVGLAARPDVSELVRYVERERDRIIINVKPVDVAEQLRQLLFGKFKTVVATSATISTGGSMAYWRERVGCDQATELEVGSPFNYAENGRLYLPLVSNDFDPTRHRSPELEGAYFERLASEMAQLVGASGGGAFLLFTSNRALRAVYELLEPKLGDRFTLLRQGQASRPRLVEQFKADGNAVLFGVKSFWEGVDVSGDALRLVVIDKFPFAPPDDPVWEARKDKITKETGDPWAWFSQLAVPYTTILIKQAVGRLIRSRSDRGVCVILDGRATGKSYGTRILKALPPMRQTRSMSEVRSFFNGR